MEPLVEVDCIRQVVQLRPEVLIVTLRLGAIPIYILVRLAFVLFLYAFIFLILIVEDGIFDFESCYKARIMPEKGAFWTHY